VQSYGRNGREVLAGTFPASWEVFLRYVALVENFSNNLWSTMIPITIRMIARKTLEQKKQTSRTTMRKGRKEVTVEERIQKANGGGWNWKQWG
jgi:hypothetical protein